MKRRELQHIVSDTAGIELAQHWLKSMIVRGLPAGPVRVSVGRPRRTLDQNSKLWPMLGDIASQVEWYGQKLTDNEWKDVFTAALRKQRAVPGLEGGFVVLGAHTSEMSKGELSELIELMYAFGADHDVEWSEPKKKQEAA